MTDSTELIKKAHYTLSLLREKASDDEASYLSILNACKNSNSSTRKLIAQTIPSYFKYFPNHDVLAFNSQLDCCEDDDSNVRILGIKGLALICKSTISTLERVAVVLSQLLITDAGHELNAVKDAFNALFKLDACGTMHHLLNQSLVSDTANTRNAALRYAISKFPEYSNEINSNVDGLNTISNDIKANLELNGSSRKSANHFLTVDETTQLINCWKSLSNFTNDNAIEASQFLNGLISQEDSTSVDSLTKFETLFSAILSLSSNGVKSFSCVEHFYNKIAPSFQDIPEKHRSTLLKLVAESVVYHSEGLTIANFKSILQPSYDLFKFNSPVIEVDNAPIINFTSVEAALLTFTAAASNSIGLVRNVCGVFIPTGQPSDFRGENFDEKKKDFATRMNILKKKIAAYTAKIKESIDILRKDADTPEKKASLQQKNSSYKTFCVATNNVATICNQLQKEHPSFQIANDISLSWKSRKPKSVLSKRGGPSEDHAPLHAATPTKKSKSNKGSAKPKQPVASKANANTNGKAPARRFKSTQLRAMAKKPQTQVQNKQNNNTPAQNRPRVARNNANNQNQRVNNNNQNQGNRAANVREQNPRPQNVGRNNQNNQPAANSNNQQRRPKLQLRNAARNQTTRPQNNGQPRPRPQGNNPRAILLGQGQPRRPQGPPRANPNNGQARTQNNAQARNQNNNQVRNQNNGQARNQNNGQARNQNNNQARNQNNAQPRNQNINQAQKRKNPPQNQNNNRKQNNNNMDVSNNNPRPFAKKRRNNRNN